MTSHELAHTYGPDCRLHPVPEPEPPHHLQGIPPIKAQFFYSSQIPLDDPLSAATAGTADGKGSLRPFSPRDNIALEKAWLSLGSPRDQKNHYNSVRHRSPSPSLSRANAGRLEAIVQDLVSRHTDKHDSEADSPTPAVDGPSVNVDLVIPVCCPELLLDASVELKEEFCAATRRQQPALEPDRVAQRVMKQLRRGRARADSAVSAASTMPITASLPQRGASSPRAAGSIYGTNQPVSAPKKVEAPDPTVRGHASSLDGTPGSPLSVSIGRAIPVRAPVVDDGISGLPFLRVGPGDVSRSPISASLPEGLDNHARSGRGNRGRSRAGSSARQPTPLSSRSAELREPGEVPVGIARLHMVSLPLLQMKPIYWSPVNDVSIVLRATWFYEDSMTPVEASVANQLEAGYRELRPWTETWSDEIRSALQVGAEGEEKVSHRLWPEDVGKNTKWREAPFPEPPISCDPFCASRCFRGEAAAEGTLEDIHPAEVCAMPSPDARSYSNYHVIFKDECKAFLLKPSLKPSAYYNRRPISKIMKGATIGTPVVRGFDPSAWDRVHKKKAAPRRPEVPAPASQPVPSEASIRCPGCQQDKQREEITDLVLVAHGIGQKYSKRVESYSFTLAINAFRRAINVELQNDAVREVLREDQNGIMVLPVNWRLAVSLDVEDAVAEDSQRSREGFTLKDIEPNSIKAVRGIISEVMFDIPFYMSSKHKPKMTAALVAEANRIMRLWARNHTGERSPRIHLIGHSLGSAMLLDILSNQPTIVPTLDPSQEVNTRHFEFNTTNLFFLGSPAGFFLLLERGNLKPRRRHQKPGADPRDTVSDDIVGDTGQFGCLAVDNIYNILAREDPIAYNLNGTIDPAYAASLKEAHLPSTATSFFDTVRGMAGLSPAHGASTPAKPPTIRLPSQLELEVHDFTREEIAEKKAFLLNDNGQIDYFIRSGGGPLEIQYLNMLSAHTSYWTNQDLVRMLCLEIGRKPGKDNTLTSMRAVKATRRQLSAR
ncbi:hypothetical protein GQ53DRAFT_746528 [Thozetella sp. PMI_491]|nr:hypothetical protein GQ53DRAFT_746528 [Thozetella sp. PMI_491]